MEDFLAWEDIQDMVDEGLIDQDTVFAAVEQVGATKAGVLTLPQFSELVDLLQDAMERAEPIDLDALGENDEDEDEDYDDDDDENKVIAGS